MHVGAVSFQPSARVLAAVVLALSGVFFACRSLSLVPKRTDAAGHETTVASPRFHRSIEGYAVPTAENLASILSACKDSLRARIDSSDGSVSIDARRIPDLGVAFQERLRALLHPDFDRSMSDMVERGWPRLDPEIRDELRSSWIEQSASHRYFPLDPSAVSVRRVSLDAIMNPMVDPLARGERRSCSMVAPPGTSGSEARAYYTPVDGLVEIGIPVYISDADQREAHGDLLFRFTWVPSLDRWRLVQTCIMYPDGDDHRFTALRPI